MTPQELQALLDREGVPMEARAPLELDDGRWMHAFYLDWKVLPALAELAHVGAMVKWLPGGIKPYPHGSRKVEISHCGDHWHISVGRHSVEHSGSLVEALAHACGRIAKEKDNA